MDEIGICCAPDHPVFGRVAERLAARGFGVEFFPIREPLARSTLDGLAAFVNTVVTRLSLGTLHRADRAGLETWNGFVPTSMLSSRLIGLHALEWLGCQVPMTTSTSTDADGIERSRFWWDERAGVRDPLFEERVRVEPVTYRYYAVDDGVETHVHAVTVRSQLDGYRPAVEDAEVDVERATRVRELLNRFDARGVAVDFVATGEEFYAIDVDPTPQFFGAGLERRIADSIASLTTIGA